MPFSASLRQLTLTSGGTATFGTFTATATATKEEDITNVNLGGQASFGSFAAAGTLTTETTTVTPHSQTVTGLGIFDTSSSRWFLNSFQLATEPWRIDDELLADPSVATYFSNIVIFDDGRVQLRLDDAPLNVFGDDPGPEFSNAFENDGTTVLTSTGGGSTITLTLTGITDTTEPYVWTPTNSQEVIDFFTASVAQGTAVTGTIRFAIGETAATDVDIAGAATFGSPSSTGALTTRTGLMLSDFDTTGLAPDALALITAGPPPSMFGRSPRPSDGMIQDGEIDISSMDEPITWLRFRGDGTAEGGARISLNDDGPLEQSGYFGTGGNGLDLTVWVQTADGNISFPVMGSVAGSGGNYVIFNVPAADQAFVAGITEGQSFIFALTRPATELAITGAATFGSPSTEATLTLVPIVNIDLVASPTFGNPSSTGTLGLVGITDVSIAGAASFGDPATTGTVVTSVTLLLAEFNANGRETDVLGLILSGPPPIIYGISPRTIGGMLLDGEMGLAEINDPITWLRFRDSGSAAGGERISLNDNGALHMRDYFLDNNPPGGDLVVWVQTLAGVISFPIAGNVQNAGNNYILLTVPAEHQAFVAGIAENDRLIFALARRTAFEPAAATMGSPSTAATLTKTAIIDVGISGTASFGDFVAAATPSLLQPVDVGLTAASSFGTPSAAATLDVLIPTNVEIGGSATFGPSSSSATINIRSPTDVGITGTATFGTPAATATLGILQPVDVGLIGTASFGAATAAAALDILPVGTISVAGSASFGASTSTGTLTTLPIVTIDHTATAAFGLPASSGVLNKSLDPTAVELAGGSTFGNMAASATLGVTQPVGIPIAGNNPTFGNPAVSALLNVTMAVYLDIDGVATFGSPASTATLTKMGIVPRDITGAANFGLPTADATLEILERQHLDLAGVAAFGDVATSGVVNVLQVINVTITAGPVTFGAPSSSAILADASRSLPVQTQIIGDGGTNGVITWENIDLRVDSSLVPPGETAYLRTLEIGVAIDSVRIRFSPDTDTMPELNDTNLIEAWERYDAAIIIEAGDLILVLAGPENSFNDFSDIDGEVYFWTPRMPGRIRDWADAYVLLPEPVRAATVLSLDDGIEFINVDISGGGAFGTASTSATLSTIQPVDFDIAAASAFGSPASSGTLEFFIQSLDLVGTGTFNPFAASATLNVLDPVDLTITTSPVAFGSPASTALLEITLEIPHELIGTATFGMPSSQLILTKVHSPVDVTIAIREAAFGRFIGHALLGVNQGHPNRTHRRLQRLGTPSSLLILSKMMVVLTQVTGVSLLAESTIISVFWTPVLDAERYVVQWRTNDESFDVMRQIITYSPNARIPNLRETTQHHIQVRAVRSGITDGIYSTVTTTTTADSVFELLMEQWRKAPRFSALVIQLLHLIDEHFIQIFPTLDRQRHIDTAIGIWLDYIGQWLGQPRPFSTTSSASLRFGFAIPVHYVINGSSPASLTTFQGITNGSLSIVDGEDATGIDLSGATSFDDVVSTLQTALNNAGTTTYNDNIVVRYDTRFEAIGPTDTDDMAVVLANPSTTHALLLLGISGNDRYSSSDVGKLLVGSLVVPGNSNVSDITITDVEYLIISSTTGRITLQGSGASWSAWVGQSDFSDFFLTIKLGDTEIPLAFADRFNAGSSFISWNLTGAAKTAFDNIAVDDAMTLTIGNPLVRALGWDIGDFTIDPDTRTVGFDQAIYSSISEVLVEREPIGDVWYRYVLHLRNGYLQTDGSVLDLTNIVDEVFPGARYMDNRDMTTELILPGINADLLQVLLDNDILQSPPGVALTVTN